MEPKSCRVRQYQIKPLSLHQRAHSFDQTRYVVWEEGRGGEEEGEGGRVGKRRERRGGEEGKEEGREEGGGIN